jgi:hypothetical protein
MGKILCKQRSRQRICLNSLNQGKKFSGTCKADERIFFVRTCTLRNAQLVKGKPIHQPNAIAFTWVEIRFFRIGGENCIMRYF